MKIKIQSIQVSDRYENYLGAKDVEINIDGDVIELKNINNKFQHVALAGNKVVNMELNGKRKIQGYFLNNKYKGGDLRFETLSEINY